MRLVDGARLFQKVRRMLRLRFRCLAVRTWLRSLRSHAARTSSCCMASNSTASPSRARLAGTGETFGRQQVILPGCAVGRVGDIGSASQVSRTGTGADAGAGAGERCQPDKLRSSARTTPLRQTSSARWMTFSSSRILPGHGYASKACCASGPSSTSPGASAAHKWHEVARQRHDVARALAQGAQRQADHLQPVIQVFAEAPGTHGFGQVHIGGRDQAHVDGMARRAPRRTTSRSCSTRSSLTCIASGKSPISSRNRVPPLAVSNQPGFTLLRARKRAFFVAKQFALDQGFGKGAAVNRHKGLLGAPASSRAHGAQ